jgi:hypothetical protein
MWRWTAWRKRTKWLWSTLIVLFWLFIILFTRRPQKELDDPFGPFGTDQTELRWLLIDTPSPIDALLHAFL